MALPSTDTSELDPLPQSISLHESSDAGDGIIAQEFLDEQYCQFKSIVEQSLKSSGADQNLVLDSLLEILYLPSRLHDSKYWKLLFKLCSRLKNLSVLDGEKQAKDGEIEEEPIVEPYSDLAMLAHHISHQGYHYASVPMWRRYLEAVVQTKDGELLLASLEGLASVSIDGGSALIGEYLSEAILVGLGPGLLKRKEALETKADEKIQEEWKTLPDELKVLISSYVAASSLEDESERRIEEIDLPPLKATETSEQTFRFIGRFCESADILAAKFRPAGSYETIGTLGLDPKVYFLQRAVESAFKAKRHFLARRLAVQLSSLLANKYRELETISAAKDSDTSTLGSKINGFCFLQLFLDLRAFVEAELPPSDPNDIDNILVNAHFVYEYYGPTLEVDTREKSSGAAKFLLLDYLTTLSHINPLTSSELIRPIIHFTNIEHGDDIKAAEAENDIFVDLYLSSWCTALSSVDSSSPTSQLLIDQAERIYSMAINREKSKLLKISNIDDADLPPLMSRIGSLLDEMMKPVICQSDIHMALLALDTWKRTVKDEEAFSRLYDVLLPHFKDLPVDMILIDAIKSVVVSPSANGGKKATISALSSNGHSLASLGSGSTEGAVYGDLEEKGNGDSKKRKRDMQNEEFSDLMPPEKTSFDDMSTTTATSGATAWPARFYPPSLPQHDEKFSLSANLVNALMPRQRALNSNVEMEVSKTTSEMDPNRSDGEPQLVTLAKTSLSGSTDILSLEEQQKQYLRSRKKPSKVKESDNDAEQCDTEDIFSELINSTLTGPQRKKLSVILDKNDLYVLIKQLEASQNEVEVGIERERKLMESVHAQRRSDMTSLQQQRLEDVARVQGEFNMHELVEQHNEELESLELEISQEIDKLELKRDLALKEKIANQQQVLQAFGVPGFKKTTDQDALALQREILILIQHKMAQHALANATRMPSIGGFDIPLLVTDQDGSVAGKVKSSGTSSTVDPTGSQSLQSTPIMSLTPLAGQLPNPSPLEPNTSSSNLLGSTSPSSTGVGANAPKIVAKSALVAAESIGFHLSPVAASELLKHVQALRSHYASKVMSSKGGSLAVGRGPGARESEGGGGVMGGRNFGNPPQNAIRAPPSASFGPSPPHLQSNVQQNGFIGHHQGPQPYQAAPHLANRFHLPQRSSGAYMAPSMSQPLYQQTMMRGAYPTPTQTQNTNSMLLATQQPPRLVPPPQSSSYLGNTGGYDPNFQGPVPQGSRGGTFYGLNATPQPLQTQSSHSSLGAYGPQGMVHGTQSSMYGQRMGPQFISSLPPPPLMISPQKQFQTLERLKLQLEARLGSTGPMQQGHAMQMNQHRAPQGQHSASPHFNQPPTYLGRQREQNPRLISNEEAMQDLQRQLDVAEQKDRFKQTAAAYLGAPADQTHHHHHHHQHHQAFSQPTVHTHHQQNIHSHAHHSQQHVPSHPQSHRPSYLPSHPQTYHQPQTASYPQNHQTQQSSFYHPPQHHPYPQAHQPSYAAPTHAATYQGYHHNHVHQHGHGAHQHQQPYHPTASSQGPQYPPQNQPLQQRGTNVPSFNGPFSYPPPSY